MSILLATGTLEVDQIIQQRIPSYSFVDSVYSTDDLITTIFETKPTHILLSELLKGEISLEEVISLIYFRFPYVHIIFISKDDDTSFHSFLQKHRIRSILSGSFTILELKEKIQNPY